MRFSSRTLSNFMISCFSFCGILTCCQFILTMACCLVKKIILFATLYKSSRKEDKLRSQIRDTYEEVRFGLVEIQFTAFF